MLLYAGEMGIKCIQIGIQNYRPPIQLIVQRTSYTYSYTSAYFAKLHYKDM